MTEIAIQIESVSKQYRLGASNAGHYGRLSEAMVAIPFAFTQAMKRRLGRSRSEGNHHGCDSTFWALRDVSFDVKQGEVCGIVGRNGAGKSTLLKVLSRITEPTSGRFGLKGRVASLLEVGTGFHTELTGRENIFLSGITLGMKRAEIKRRFDEIVEFSGVERFLDTAVKHYSSGMQVRLGFSVAAHLESEILIVDEVLAVGDAGFQKKCLGKLSDVAGSGRTALFVSHNLVAVKNLCSSAVLLDEGRAVMKGDADQVVAAHLKTLGSPTTVLTERIVDAGGISKIASCRVVDAHGETPDKFSIDEALEIQLDIELDAQCEKVAYGIVFHFYFEDGTLAFASASPKEQVLLVPSARSRVRHRWSCVVPAMTLNEGQYILEVVLISADLQMLGRYPDLVSFETDDTKPRGGWFGKWVGVVRPACRWTPPSQSD